MAIFIYIANMKMNSYNVFVKYLVIFIKILNRYNFDIKEKVLGFHLIKNTSCQAKYWGSFIGSLFEKVKNWEETAQHQKING